MKHNLLCLEGYDSCVLNGSSYLKLVFLLFKNLLNFFYFKGVGLSLVL